jgi:hypothetical protein
VRIVIAFLLAVAASFPPPDPAVIGLDHIPIAVGDLARAADDYRALGFALKPGRPHDNGIQNQHVKFTDGTELELITAPAAGDALTTTYRRHLENGDGPAFLAGEVLRPTVDWKLLKTQIKKDEFEVATDLFYINVTKQ